MKISVSVALGLFSFAIFSCGSFNVMVPGERNVIERTISEEYFSIAEAYKNQSNYNKAIEYYSLALKDRKLHDSAYYKIALCQVYSKNWSKARKSFVKLLQKDPDNASLKMSLAYIEANCGNLKKASKMYDAICSERPDDSEPLVNYINVLIASEKYSEAKEKLTLLETKFPDEEHVDPLKSKISELVEDADEAKSEGQPDSPPQSEENTSKEDLFGLSEEIKED